MRAGSLMAAVMALVAAGCSNSGGKVLGPSGVSLSSLGATCQVPCETLDDCKKHGPMRDASGSLIESLPYVWLECRNGACVDVACVTDGDCSTREDGKKVTCVQNQCAMRCSDIDCTSSRDKCEEGYCLRIPEVPDPNCTWTGNCDANYENCEQIKCECYDNSACPPWNTCRLGNRCEAYASDGSTSSSGRSCDSDEQCGYFYLVQAMWEAGLSTDVYKGSPMCLESCDVPGATSHGFGSCGNGFECVSVRNAVLIQGLPTSRTVCMPNECRKDAGCTPSFEECDSDTDCGGDNACTFPMTGCRGVCLDVACDACKAWFEGHNVRKCIAADIDIPVSVRRPD